MKILDFLNRENQKCKGLDAKSKTEILLQSIKTEIKENKFNKLREAMADTILMAKYESPNDYSLRLKVSQSLLENFLQSGNLDLNPLPVPFSQKDYDSYLKIKELLKTIIFLSNNN